MTQNMTRIALVTCLVALAGTASAQVRPAPQPGPIAVQPIRPPEVKPLIRVKVEQPTIQTATISPTLKVPEPTEVQKAEQPLDVKMAVVPLALRDQVDPRKYGFTDVEAMKVSARKALGLPQGFPISIREQVDAKYGQREGLVVTGTNPLLLDARFQPLSIEVFRQRLVKDAGSVLGKPKQ